MLLVQCQEECQDDSSVSWDINHSDRYSTPQTTSSDSVVAEIKDMKIYVKSVFVNIYNHLRWPLHTSVLLPERNSVCWSLITSVFVNQTKVPLASEFPCVLILSERFSNCRW